MSALSRLLFIRPAVLFFGVIFFAIPAQAQTENEDDAIIRSVTVLTPPGQLAELCATPRLSVSGNNSRIAGNRSVIAQCGNQKKFIQVKIQAEGSWWTASRALKAGSLIRAADIALQSGAMDRLPPGLISHKEDIIGQVTTRAINAGQPVLESHLRKRWKVLAGQEVEVLAAGEGFQIRTSGKALDNAALDETLRIKTRSGQVISGKATAEGKVSIFIKE